MFKKMFRRYMADQRGVAAIVFAMMLPMIAASAGIAVDLATAYNAKNRLGNALDKAVLSAASSTGTDSELKARMQAFFAANYPADKYGTPYDINLVISGSVMTVSANVRVPTTFMSMFGKEYMDVHEESQVVRELAGIETVLVLDITGSMAGNNITALKTASNNFLNTMFSKVKDVQYIKIGIVPWSNAVNVGNYGKGFTPTGATYDTPFVDNPSTDPYVTPASSIKYGSGTYDWDGCVLERSGTSAMKDTSSPNWGMYRYPSGKCAEYNCTQYNCAQYNCAQYNCAQYNCTKYQCVQYNCTKYNSRGECTRTGTTCLQYNNTCIQTGSTCIQYSSTCKTYGNTCVVQGTTCIDWGNTCIRWSGDPNTNCPSAPIVPLTNNKATLKSSIDSLPTQGNTYSNLGMLWGWRVISPEFPFREGAAYDDHKWSKTVILMTDGDNTINTVYSGEGVYGASGTSTTVADQNKKFSDICTAMKEKGIRIYTITFQSAINASTKSVYRNCATTTSMYYDAPSNQNLIDAFQKIADQLSQLHITK